MDGTILAIDQGTTSTRAIVFDAELRPLASGQREFRQIYPAPGWVEHDPEDLWSTTVETCRAALRQAGADAKRVAGIGLTNQRETAVAWNRADGKPLGNAIVWQDRRTAARCEELRRAGNADAIAAATGLVVDPYFSAAKIEWMLANIDGARALAARGNLCVGTIDSFLVWRLTGGKVFVTDATNASRTMLYDIRRGSWSADLLALFSVPEPALARVEDCAAEFGATDPALFGAAIPIRGIAGDQQAALIGQGCFAPGAMKATFGTGCFALLNTGPDFVHSRHRLLTTIGYRFAGKTSYALEGSIFVAGASVQWLRDGLGILDSAAESGALAARAAPDSPVVLVPAFVGLGAPYWDPDCRGAIFGLTRDAGRAELAQAALESACFQMLDLREAMAKDWVGGALEILRVDGGMAASDWMVQRLADLIDAPVDRAEAAEATALGAAYLAGWRAGLCPPPEDFAKIAVRRRRFAPHMDAATRRRRIELWRDAVRRTLTRS